MVKYSKLFRSLTVGTLATMFLVTGCSSKEGSSQPSPGSSQATPQQTEKMVVKLGHVTNDQSAIHKGSIKFKELVESKSNGQIEVQVIPGGQLGSEKDLVESTKLGTIQITIPSAAVLSNFVPKAAVLTLPYVIKGNNEREKYATFQKLSTTPEFKEIAAEAESVGLVAFPEAVWWVGDRHVTTKEKPVKTVDDLQGMKIRTPDAPAHTEPFKILGANVTPMNIAEVYMALKTGTIEAQENSVNQIYTNKFHEVQNYVNLTGHMTQNELPVVSQKWWKSLTPEQQKVVSDAMFEAGEYMSELQLKANEDELVELQKNGMEVIQVDLEPFRNATKDVYKVFEDKVGKGYYEKLVEAQK